MLDSPPPHFHGNPMEEYKGYQSLRRYRVSLPNRSYFLTFTVQGRKPVLHNTPCWNGFQAALSSFQENDYGHVRTAVLMPDHLHMLLKISGKWNLGQCVAYFKQKIRMSAKNASYQWQKGYYDHLVRPNEALLPIFRYIYQNPEKAGLHKEGPLPPYYYCCPEDWIWFSVGIHEEHPLPPWLNTSEHENV